MQRFAEDILYYGRQVQQVPQQMEHLIRKTRRISTMPPTINRNSWKVRNLLPTAQFSAPISHCKVQAVTTDDSYKSIQNADH
jgi:hypothetical protein